MKDIKKYFYFSVLFLNFLMAMGQPYTVDSLNALYKTAKHDSTRLRLLVKLSFECGLEDIPKYAGGAIELADKLLKNKNDVAYRQLLLKHKSSALGNLAFMNTNTGRLSEAIENYEECLKINRELRDTAGIALFLYNIGGVFYYQGNNAKAIEYFEKSLKLEEETGNLKGVAHSLNNLGNVYKNLGDIPKALDYEARSLKIHEKNGDKHGIALMFNNIGSIYHGENNFSEALNYYNKSLKMREEMKDKDGQAYSLQNIGVAYRDLGNYPVALQNLEKGLRLQEEIGDKRGMAFSLLNLGDVNTLLNRLNEALVFLKKALLISKEVDDKESLAGSFENLADVYFKQNNYPLARAYSDSAFALAKKLGFPEKIKTSEGLLSKIDSATGNMRGAFLHYKQFILYSDSINNDRTRKASIKNQLKYEYEKKEAVLIQQQEKENALAKEKNHRQQIIIFSVILGLLLVAVFALFVFRNLKTTRKQKHIIEEHQKEILDSIHYAKRIQTSLLPTDKYIERILKQKFN